MVEKILLILFLISFPALVLYASYKIKILAQIGPIILCYATGLILGNVGIIPEAMENTQITLASVMIPLALPLLLFSIDIRKFKIVAGTTLKATILALIAVVIAVASGYYLFGKHIPEAWKISGLLIGVYTGGTPNLASLQTALDVSPSEYIVTHASDTLISIVFLLYLLTYAKKTLLWILPKFPDIDGNTENEFLFQQKSIATYDDSPKAYRNMHRISSLKDLAIAMAITIVIVLISAGIASLFPKNYFDPIIILSITTLSIIASLFKKIRNLKNTFQLGMYFILVFSITVASLGKFDKLIHSSPYILYYVAWAIFISFFIHIFLSAIFKVDADSTIIVTTAFIMSPPFVPVVASAIKNKYVIISGLLTGILGYAIGNYLGILVAYALK